MSDWNQPCCDPCWRALEDEEPVRVAEPREEKCAFCGRLTLSGIFMRADPEKVLFPREERKGDG